MSRRVLVFGPAYLDRVLRVDRPLLPPELGGPLDLSVGVLPAAPGPSGDPLQLRDPEGGTIEVELPDDWPDGPGRVLSLDRPLAPGAGPWTRRVRGLSWLDDLGGMGSGYAAALGGELVGALGDEAEPISARIETMLADHRIAHHPARVPGAVADWTLLLTSGPHGDKLPIGFRGCHSRLSTYPGPTDRSWDVLVAASLTNRLVASALESVDAPVRVFAPTLRNMTDAEFPVSRFVDRIDLLCCNRKEWESLADRESLAGRIPVVSITDGPAGGLVRYRDPSGIVQVHVEPAFPRRRLPRDTNRAGECYAATLLTSLLDLGWRSGPVDEATIRSSARRAAAAAALVIDLERFGFPTAEQVDHALELGEVA